MDVTEEAGRWVPDAADPPRHAYTPRHGGTDERPTDAPGTRSGGGEVSGDDTSIPTAPFVDAGRFELLVAEVHTPLLSYLLRRTDRESAADVLGDVLLVLWRRRAEIPPDAALPWSYGVARRCLANARRGADRQKALAARLVVLDPPRPVDEPEAADVVDDRALRGAMSRLTPPEAEVLSLWAWEDLTPAEIAVTLDVTPNAVSIRLHRAKTHLRERLEVHDRKERDGSRTGTGRGEEEEP